MTCCDPASDCRPATSTLDGSRLVTFTLSPPAGEGEGTGIPVLGSIANSERVIEV